MPLVRTEDRIAHARVQFNLETPDADVFREHTRIYRSISSSLSPPTFQLQVLLCIPELTPNQVLAYVAPDSSRAPVDPTPKYILLESWTIDFAPHQVQYQYGEERSDVAPPTIYKHGISLFRSIYTLLRILPAWKLARRQRRPAGGNFSIVVRIEGGDLGALNGVLGFGESLLGASYHTRVLTSPQNLSSRIRDFHKIRMSSRRYRTHWAR